MKRFFQYLLYFFVYSGLLIALSASALAAEVFVVLDINMDFSYLAFVFTATLLTYSVHRILGIRKIKEKYSNERFAIIYSLRPAIASVTIISSCALAYLITIINQAYLWQFGIAGIICFFYVMPLIHFKKRLRDIPFIKILLISAAWTFVANMPIINKEMVTQEPLILSLMTIEKFVFIFLITLPFDIRDYEIDLSMNVKTFAHSLGAERVYPLIYLLIIISAILMVSISWELSGNLLKSLLLAFPFLMTYLAVSIGRNKKSDLYYSGVLDGVILIRSLMVIFLIS